MPGRGPSTDLSETIELKPLLARTASEYTGSTPLHGGVTGIIFYVNVTAVSGTSPTLTVTIRDSPDGSMWTNPPSNATASITIAGWYRIAISGPLGNFIQAGIAIGGTTPSFTFSIVAVLE